MTGISFLSSSPIRDANPPIDSGSGLPIPPPGHREPADGGDDSFSKGMDSASREHDARSRGMEHKPPRYLFARISVFLIMLMWVIPGFLKIKDMSAFVNIVEKHEVLPERYEPLLWWVGPGELVMGLLLVFVMGSELRKPFGKFVLLLSMSAIIGFTYYLSLVSDAVIMESGCGCLGDRRVFAGMENGPRYFAYGKNLILLILHVVALVGPAIVDSRRKQAG